jgi:hypothetical protein
MVTVHFNRIVSDHSFARRIFYELPQHFETWYDGKTRLEWLFHPAKARTAHMSAEKLWTSYMHGSPEQNRSGQLDLPSSRAT